MEHNWYILLEKEEGPFTIAELRTLPSITPETLVRKKGSDVWRPISEVPELKSVFQDPKPLEEKPAIIRPSLSEAPGDESVLSMDYQPPQWMFWWIIILIILIYVYFNLVKT
ncbi:MAG: hypothetical protein Tsb0021_05800 [Chlamydiales bacterium]